MANITARLYIRSAEGYSTPPKKLVDLSTGQMFYLVWYEENHKRARSVGRFADKAQVALINQQSDLRKAVIPSRCSLQSKIPDRSYSRCKPSCRLAATQSNGR